MNKLPPEIISTIVGHLGDKTDDPHLIQDTYRLAFPYQDRILNNSVAQYASISKQWQDIIETATFRHLLLTPARLETALQLLTPSRLSRLRLVKVDCILDADELKDQELSMSEYTDCLHERVRNIMQSLFRLLEATPPAAKPLVTIHLSIPLPSYVFVASLWAHPWHDIPRPSNLPIISMDRNLVDVGSKSVTYLKLAQEVYQELPDLPMVSTFMVSLDAYGVAFEPRFICLLASKMSRLETVQWEFSDAEKRNRELRIRQRDGLVDNMDKLPLSVKDFTIRYIREMPRDDTIEPPSMVPAGQVDRLSRALRQFSLRPNVESFIFDGCVDSEILWPSNIDDGLPHWPNMRFFAVKMASVLPSGKWVALLDPDDEERGAGAQQIPNSIPGEDRLRETRAPADLQIFDKLCLASGKAAGQMPNLEHPFVSFGGDNDRSKWADTSLSFEPRRRPRLEESPLEIRAQPVLDPIEETIKVWRETSARLGVEFWMRLTGHYDVEDEGRDVR
ncbi:hypothetical protein CEP51_001232 [Fusarium floridanum]|uniref:F-box domain-containing protein n=1 Tax=Fusarium floridanum TaxID=1325733 RepID=A0A428SI80_9HYPO|nr:hypothetical protein CEP51_001232 [Fusarium floridanum]